MEHWQYLLVLAAGLSLLLAAVCSAVRKYKDRKHRDFTRKLETLLQPRETVKVICPQKESRCILTNTRIIFEERGDFTAFPLKSVRKIQGKNKEGNRCSSPKNMVSMTIYLDREFVLYNNCPEFSELVFQMQERLKKQAERKKQGKQSG